MKRLLTIALPIVTMLMPGAAFAELWQGNPNSFALVDYRYERNGTVVYSANQFIGCSFLQFDDQTDDGTKNRFWSLILTARATNTSMRIFYSQNAPCIISSFDTGV